MTTQENYIRSVYKVVFYIEKHYGQNLSLDKLSEVAGFSKYHFHRIFKSVMDENVTDYIRKIRLQNTIVKFKMDKNITQIAQESGYETNASFSKAFKKRFGMSPRDFAKKIEKNKGDVMITPEFVELEPIDILYVKKMGDYMNSADAAWRTMVEFITKHNLFTNVAVRYGISHDNPNVIEEENLRYDACVEFKDAMPTNEGEIGYKQIAGGKYAVFIHKGSYAKLGETFKEIGTWIVTNGVPLRDEPQVQKYLDLDPTIVNEKELRTEIYIPIDSSY